MAESQSFHHEVRMVPLPIFLAPDAAFFMHLSYTLGKRQNYRPCMRNVSVIFAQHFHPTPVIFQVLCFTNTVQGYCGIITTVILSAKGKHPNDSFKYNKL